jgi:hypothetical protein
MMLRHLQNLNELVIYAGLSCGAAFIARIFPPFYFPILLLRLGVFGYCLFVIAKAEGDKELASVIGAALLLGVIGGNWDWFEVWLRFNSDQVASVFCLLVLCGLGMVGFYLFIQGGSNGKTSKK